jgi:DNA-binding CsgD family transcriptional regulator
MDRLRAARECYSRQAWREACDRFLPEADDLAADDLERLGVCAYLVGRNSESDRAWSRGYQRHLDQGDVTGAGRCAFWLGFRLVNAHDWPDANAWIARLERLVRESAGDDVGRAQLAYLTGLRTVFDGGNLGSAADDLTTSADLATRGNDEELAALARIALGRVRIFLGDVTEGVRLLDDAMLAIRSGPVSPVAAGDSYCTAIDASHDLFDIHRGQAWTEAMTRWCDQQPDLVPFAGVCQVHRAEFLRLKGAWAEAMTQADLARARLSEPFRQLLYGAAVYQQGEIHRLQGHGGRAETCYREASEAGCDPQPGLSLLRLRQGRTADAARAIDRALAEADNGVARAQLLAAHVEIMLAAKRDADAEASVAELGGVASVLGSPMLGAVALQAGAALRIARGDARGALSDLRRASDVFRELDAPYEVARTSLLIGQARRGLGDEEGAALELSVASALFDRLGARADLARMRAEGSAGLTAREIQVLRLVASGETNRSIGSRLGLSERTVDRHVSNIFAKLGVSSRAAATALAYQAELL